MAWSLLDLIMDFKAIEEMSREDRIAFYKTLSVDDLWIIAEYFAHKLCDSVDKFIDSSYVSMDDILPKYEEAAKSVFSRL